MAPSFCPQPFRSWLSFGGDWLCVLWELLPVSALWYSVFSPSPPPPSTTVIPHHCLACPIATAFTVWDLFIHICWLVLSLLLKAQANTTSEGSSLLLSSRWSGATCADIEVLKFSWCGAIWGTWGGAGGLQLGRVMLRVLCAGAALLSGSALLSRSKRCGQTGSVQLQVSGAGGDTQGLWAWLCWECVWGFFSHAQLFPPSVFPPAEFKLW